MTFTVAKLTGQRAVIRGTDVFGAAGEFVVNTQQWDEVNANTAFDQATAAFEAAVEEFFAPIAAAADQLNNSMKRPDDPASYVVLAEEVEGRPAQKANLVRLTRDSIVLRLIESGDTGRLCWVNGELEVLEVSAAVPTQAGAGSTGASDSVATEVIDPQG